MTRFLILLVDALTTAARLFRPSGARALIAENLLLKQQLLIVCRARRRAPNLSVSERFVLGFLTLLVRPARIARIAIAVRPSTLLRFHQFLVARKYRELFSPKRRSKPGPKGPSADLVHAIVELKRRNPRFGCPRIALIIANAFGVEIDRNLVRRVLAQHYRPQSGGNGPSWLTFLGHAKDALWSVDLFRCASIMLKSHWVMVVMDQFTRQIIGFAAHAGHPDGVAVCRMFNRIVAGVPLPRYLSSDHDPLFEYHRWRANLSVLGVDEVKSVPYAPVSHPFVERLIGTIRREFLDLVLFWSVSDLERKLGEFQRYFNAARAHASLGTTPKEMAGESTHTPARLDDFRWRAHCRGLVELPVAA